MTIPPPRPDGKPGRGRLLLDDIQAVLERFEDAQKRRRLANLTEADDRAYQRELLEASAEELAAGRWLGDLLLLLLRYGTRHRPEALADRLSEALRPALVDGLAEHFEDLARRVLAAELPDALRQLGGSGHG
jgi:hypothetical protein